ncbi:unnamed protein product, partial [Rotaria sp. Silwood2]
MSPNKKFIPDEQIQHDEINVIEPIDDFLGGDASPVETLVYGTALRQNRVGDVITDITRSLDNFSSKSSVLMNNTSDTNLNDMKQIEIYIAKLRVLLNDIELISYNIEQLKQSDSDDEKKSIVLINKQWKDLLKQTG